MCVRARSLPRTLAPALLQRSDEGQNLQLASSADETKEPIIGAGRHRDELLIHPSHFSGKLLGRLLGHKDKDFLSVF